MQYNQSSPFRTIIQRACNFLWKNESYIVYALASRAPARRQHEDLDFSGIHGLEKMTDHSPPGLLAAPYNEFFTKGDMAVFAWKGDVLAGWVWTKRGPFTEPLGCGRIKYGADVLLIRYFETVTQMQHRGIGFSILAELTDRLLARGHTKSFALVNSHNGPSRTCFEKSGYRAVRTVSLRRLLRIPLTLRLTSKTAEG